MLARIHERLDSLSPAEGRVANWVIAHPRQAAEATLAEVARASGASEPTVIRFCRHVGLDGFRDLSRRLTETLSRPTGYLYHDVGADDTTADAVLKVVDTSIQALVDLRAGLVDMPFETAVEALVDARQIVFAGLGASGHVAGDACHKFFRLGIPCSALTDLPGILQFAAIAGDSDVVLFISSRGAWRDIAEAAALAGQRGASVVALTDPGSPLAEAAAIVLPCRSVEDTSVYTPMSSRLAHLAVLDAVHVALALALGRPASENLRASKSVILGRIGR
jgi:RpiR family carbohydrate utilization transcriptional regulator